MSKIAFISLIIAFALMFASVWVTGELGIKLCFSGILMLSFGGVVKLYSFKL